jgi:hypothetical protein
MTRYIESTNPLGVTQSWSSQWEAKAWAAGWVPPGDRAGIIQAGKKPDSCRETGDHAEAPQHRERRSEGVK